MPFQRIFPSALFMFSLLATSLLLTGCDQGTKTADAPADKSVADESDSNAVPTPAVDPPTPSADTPPAETEIAQSTPQSDSSKGKASSPKGETSKTEKPSPAESAVAQKKPAKEITSLEGRWMLMLYQRGGAFALGLIDVDPATSTVTFVDSNPNMEEPAEFDSGKVEDGTIEIRFHIGTSNFVFKGTLADNAVRGNMFGAPAQNDIAELVPSTLETMERQRPGPHPDLENLVDAARTGQQEKSIDNLLAFISEHPGNPVTLDGYEFILSLATAEGEIEPALDAQAITKIADDYLDEAHKWGKLAAEQSLLKVANTLMMAPKYHEAAMSYFDRFMTQADDNTPQAWLDQAKLGQARSNVKSDNEEKQQQGLAYLTEYHQENPLNKSITTLLAENAEASGQVDEAIAYYAELAALPPTGSEMSQMQRRMMNPASSSEKLPIEHFNRLWTEKNGSEEGGEEYLENMYREKIHAIAAPRESAGPKEKQQVVLCELFTGAPCPPCVAPDVAISALETIYSPSEVVVLRYHQHIPNPDPLVNEESEARFFYYSGKGTPTIFVNGEETERMPGMLDQVPEVYEKLSEQFDEALTRESDLKIQLTAEADQGVITIKASTDKIENLESDYRLRIVLAEDEVDFNASNGVRFHEMVVRAMPGGADGIIAKEGRFEFSTTINIDELRDKLNAYLTGYEKSMANGQTLFRERPLALNKLHAVAFIQKDDRTHPVLQTVAVPVTGSLETPEKTETPEVAPPVVSESETKPEAEAKPAPEKPAAVPENNTEEKPADEKPAVEEKAEPAASDEPKSIPAPSPAEDAK